jgi:hypothetical protein
MLDLCASQGHVPQNYFGDLSAAAFADYFGDRAIVASNRWKTSGGLREGLRSEIVFASAGGGVLAG